MANAMADMAMTVITVITVVTEVKAVVVYPGVHYATSALFLRPLAALVPSVPHQHRDQEWGYPPIEAMATQAAVVPVLSVTKEREELQISLVAPPPARPQKQPMKAERWETQTEHQPKEA
jgi:hypothetical protein